MDEQDIESTEQARETVLSNPEKNEQLAWKISNGLVTGLMKLKTVENETNKSQSECVQWESTFTRPASIGQTHNIALKFHPVQSLLSGDIALLMIVLGIQSTSATCPCYRCLIKLNQLRTRERFGGAPC